MSFLFFALLLMGKPNSDHAEQRANLSQERTTLDALVPELLKRHDVPAVGIAVANQEGVVFSAVYGEARPGVMANEQTLFNVASVAKLLTSETILRLVVRGDFNLDQSMEPIWVDPDIVDDPRHKMLTPRHALAHQTGFPNWRAQQEGRRLAFLFDPGTRPGYSGEGYEYVARFVENVTQKAFPELVRHLVLEPAQISDMAFRGGSPQGKHFAWSRNKEGVFAQADTAAFWSVADDLYTTPNAFAQFLSTLLRGSLTPQLEAERRKVQFDLTGQFCARKAFADICPEAIGFGLSGVVFRYKQETVIWQGGGDAGERAVVFFVPEKNIAMVLFTNGANGARLFAPIAELFYDNPLYVAFLKLQGEQE